MALLTELRAIGEDILDPKSVLNELVRNPSMK